ncbi:TPX2 domain-containing protein [Balamuthia mandrillaris]
MDQKEEGGRKLSSHILGMKFMQRKKEAELREERRAEEEQKIKDAHWVLDEAIADGLTVIVDERRNVGSKIKTGRRSFGNFNPTIERLLSGKSEEAKPATEEVIPTWSAVYRHREQEKQKELERRKTVYGRDRKRALADNDKKQQNNASPQHKKSQTPQQQRPGKRSRTSSDF